MSENKDITFIRDFATGKEIPLIGSEENRQAVEKMLINDKGYDSSDIDIDVEIAFNVKNMPYKSKVDLIVTVDKTRFMLVKCVAGSIGSWEREALAAARIIAPYPIPFTLVSDGNDATVINTITGKVIGNTAVDIPTKNGALQYLANFTPNPLPDERFEKERLIFRTYDTMNVNVLRDE
ncbi:MAG: type I restriction enzyme HsdR N-terminal domain-containing protein [Desulfobacterales bacterium]